MRKKLHAGLKEATVASITAGLCLGAVGMGVSPARAATATQCTGTITDRTITGDVQVPAGATCVLQRVTVRGSVLTVPNASALTLTSARVTGDVSYSDRNNPTQQAASFTSTNSRVDGTTDLTHTFIVSVTGSTLTGDVMAGVSCAHACPDTHLTTTTIRDSRLGGDLMTGFGATQLSGSRVAGQGRFASDTTITSSRLGSLVQSSTEHYITIAPMSVSRTTVVGNTELDAHPDVPVVLGAGGGNRFLGDLTVKAHGGTVTMNHNTVSGNASADTVPDGDDHPNGLTLTGRKNTFAGGTAGYFVDFAQHQ